MTDPATDDTQTSTEPTTAPEPTAAPSAEPARQEPAKADPPKAEPSLDHIPEKFKRATVEETLKAAIEGYTGLEKKLGQKSQQTTEPALDPDADFSVFLTKAGITDDAIRDAVSETGDLTEAQYNALYEKAGVPIKVAKQVINGFKAEAQAQKMRAQSIENTVYQAAGGEDAAQELFQAAQKTLTQAELARIDDMVNGDGATPESAKMAVDLLRFRTGQSANQPRPVEGQQQTGSTQMQFANSAQLDKAMADERFSPVLPNGMRNPKHDPQYYRQVNEAVTKMPLHEIHRIT